MRQRNPVFEIIPTINASKLLWTVRKYTGANVVHVGEFDSLLSAKKAVKHMNTPSIKMRGRRE